MVASLVQSAAAASTVNGPASVTPTLGGGSTQGNLLLLVVAVSSSAGGNPTITTPANWTLISSSNGSNNATAVFARPLNPGGITSVAVTVNATNGGAVGALFEYSGLGNSIFGQTPEYSNNLNGAGTGLGNVFSQQQVAYIQEL